MRVLKRDKTVQPWDRLKVEHALLKSFHHMNETANINELAGVVEKKVMDVGADPIDIEAVQTFVIETLQDYGHHTVANHYRRYRDQRNEQRAERLHPDSRILSDFIAVTKYSRWLPDEQRRETWDEACDRVELMHVNKFSSEQAEIRLAMSHVRAKAVLPSMRSMQFGGAAIEDHNVRMYNCAFTHANRLRVFGETFYNLLCGTGCGLSVQFHHVEALPPLVAIDKSRVTHFTVPDSIVGWADSVNELIRAHFITGEHVEFDYSRIRPEGARLQTSGGLAPGHLALKRMHEVLRSMLADAAYRQLRPIEVADAICHIAEAVLAGGIRRSSLIILFSPEDSEMAHSKVPGNFEFGGKNSQRAMMNISAHCLRKQTPQRIIRRLIGLARHFGDPGIYWADDMEVGCNPCGEIGMRPILRDDVKVQATPPAPDGFDYAVELGGDARMMDKTLDYEPASWEGLNDFRAIELYGHSTGWQFCNVSEVNVATCKTEAEFRQRCWAAAYLGTLQAAYTSFPYLGPVTEAIVRREALCGVSLTGMCDNPAIAFDAGTLRSGAQVCVETNRQVASRIKINAAARMTTIKPSGTASLVLGCVGSGVHPHHARRYFRRVTENPLSPVGKFFRQFNPQAVETKPNGDLSITFCVEAPDAAITVKKEPALTFMDKIFVVYDNWIMPGHVHGAVTHNVSCTVVVGDDEWQQVIERFISNRNSIGAMSFLGRYSDKGIPFMPREEVVTPADEAKWNYLCSTVVPIDYTLMKEFEDGTTHSLEPACAGGACEL